MFANTFMRFYNW